MFNEYYVCMWGSWWRVNRHLWKYCEAKQKFCFESQQLLKRWRPVSGKWHRQTGAQAGCTIRQLTACVLGGGLKKPKKHCCLLPHLLWSLVILQNRIGKDIKSNSLLNAGIQIKVSLIDGCQIFSWMPPVLECSPPPELIGFSLTELQGNKYLSPSGFTLAFNTHSEFWPLCIEHWPVGSLLLKAKTSK